MKGVKAVFETMLSGPVRVRVLARYNTYEVICQVTGRGNYTWRTGLLFVTVPQFLWCKHRYVGKLRCHISWEGRPDLSGLPEATPKLLKQLEEQS